MFAQHDRHQLSSLYLLNLVALPYISAIICTATLSQVRSVSQVSLLSQVAGLTMQWHPMCKDTHMYQERLWHDVMTIFITTFLEFTFSHKGLMFEAAKLGTSYMSIMALQGQLVISVQALLR